MKLNFLRSIEILTLNISNRPLFAPLLDIVFSTAHKAKGLEFDTVRITDDFLPGSDTGMMSLRKSFYRASTFYKLFPVLSLQRLFYFRPFFVYDKLKAPISAFFLFPPFLFSLMRNFNEVVLFFLSYCLGTKFINYTAVRFVRCHSLK